MCTDLEYVVCAGNALAGIAGILPPSRDGAAHASVAVMSCSPPAISAHPAWPSRWRDREIAAALETSRGMSESLAWIHPLTDRQRILVTLLPLYHIFALEGSLLLFTHLGWSNVLVPDARNLPAVVAELAHHP